LMPIIPFHSFDGRREIRFRRKGRGRWSRGKIGPKQSVNQSDIGWGQIRIDFGREEIVKIGARPIDRLRCRFVAIDDVIGRAFVGPSRPVPMSVEDAKMVLVRIK
jgi:hypothetical protein